ncbi:MAG: hypothetical protein ACXVY3_00245 [Gaiellaceae bacterium]
MGPLDPATKTPRKEVAMRLAILRIALVVAGLATILGDWKGP